FLLLLFTKRRYFSIPLCLKHRDLERWKKYAAGVGLLVTVGFIGLTLWLLPPQHHLYTDELLVLFAIGALVGFFVGVASRAVIEPDWIRATYISEMSVTLKGVAPEFVEAYQRSVQAAAEEQSRRLRTR